MVNPENMQILFDLDFRKKLRANPKLCLEKLEPQIVVNDNVEYIIKTNTRDTQYFIFVDMSELNDELVKEIQGGVGTSTAGSVGTAGTLACISTVSVFTTSTFSSIGTAGTAGTAKN